MNQIDIPLRGKTLEIKETWFHIDADEVFHTGYWKNFGDIAPLEEVKESRWACGLAFEGAISIFGVSYDRLNFQRDYEGRYIWYGTRVGDQCTGLTGAARGVLEDRFGDWAKGEIDRLQHELRADWGRGKAKEMFEMAAELERHAKLVRERALSFAEGQFNQLPKTTKQ